MPTKTSNTYAKNPDITPEQTCGEGMYIASGDKNTQYIAAAEDKSLKELSKTETDFLKKLCTYDGKVDEYLFNGCKTLARHSMPIEHIELIFVDYNVVTGKKGMKMSHSAMDALIDIKSRNFIDNDSKSMFRKLIKLDGSVDKENLQNALEAAENRTKDVLQKLYQMNLVPREAQDEDLEKLVRKYTSDSFSINGIFEKVIEVCKNKNGSLNKKMYDKLYTLYPLLLRTGIEKDTLKLCMNKKGQVNESAIKDVLALNAEDNFGPQSIKQYLEKTRDKDGNYVPVCYNRVCELKKRGLNSSAIFDILESCFFGNEMYDNKVYEQAIYFLDKYGAEYTSIEAVGKYLTNCRNHPEKLNPDAVSYQHKMLDKDIPLDTIGWITDVCLDETKGKFDDKLFKAAMKHWDEGTYKFSCYGLLKAYKGDDKKFSQKRYDSLEEARTSLFANRNLLRTAAQDLSDKAINQFYINTPVPIVNAIELAGFQTFEQAYKMKMEGLRDFCKKCSLIKQKAGNKYDRLLMFTNPVESKTYTRRITKLPDEIAELKKRFPQAKAQGGTVFEELKREINTKTAKLNEAQKAGKRKTDPQVLINKLRALSALLTGVEFEDAIVMKNFENPDEKNWREFVEKRVFDKLDIPYDEAFAKRLDLINNKYIGEILSSNSDFKENCRLLFNLIRLNPDKSTFEIFNMLEQNQETKKQFEELGINYEKWALADKNSFKTVKVALSAQEAKQAAIKNLEADFNDTSFKVIPGKETDKIFEKLKEINVELKENIEILYDNNGFPTGNAKRLRLFKGGERIDFKDLPEIISTIKTAVNQNVFWTVTNANAQINTAKNLVYEHIMKLRDVEIKNALNLNEDTVVNLEIRKTDMNNAEHTLFLGNHAHCCTAVGTGANQFSAPVYVMNKCVGAIEIADGKECVGNTMCFIAKIDGKPALFLDNIEMSTKYQNNNRIRDTLAEYAKQLCSEIGAPDMSIYAGPFRHKMNMDIYPLNEYDFSLVGSSGDLPVYLDFATKEDKINPETQYKTKLYKIR